MIAALRFMVIPLFLFGFDFMPFEIVNDLEIFSRSVQHFLFLVVA